MAPQAVQQQQRRERREAQQREDVWRPLPTTPKVGKAPPHSVGRSLGITVAVHCACSAGPCDARVPRSVQVLQRSGGVGGGYCGPSLLTPLMYSPTPIS